MEICWLHQYPLHTDVVKLSASSLFSLKVTGPKQLTSYQFSNVAALRQPRFSCRFKDQVIERKEKDRTGKRKLYCVMGLEIP